jgi:hypothetical protein
MVAVGEFAPGPNGKALHPTSTTGIRIKSSFNRIVVIRAKCQY